jgi:uncharacterized membrane protein (UPF0127 family)
MSLDPRLQQLARRDLGDGLTLLVADSRRTRGRGLAGLDDLPADHALLLEPCRSVHTIGMRFALDLIWLDADGNALRVDPAVTPRRVRSCLRARSVVECRAGDGQRFAPRLAPD